MKIRTKVSMLFIVVALAAAVVLRISTKESQTEVRRQPKALVKVELPKRETITRNLSLTGNIIAIQQAQVFARVYGNIETVNANAGDFVKANQLLARIDTTELAQQYRQAEATYQNAQAVYDRAKPLQDQNLISKQDLDNARTSMEVARENVESARTRLEYADITAPFSGYITRRFLDAGNLVSSSNATLFNLMDLDTVKVIVNILEKDVPSVKTGMTAVVTADAIPGREFTGPIARMSQAVDLATRTMPIEIDIANRDHTLKPGMFANVSIIIDQKNDVLTLPVEAVLRDADGYYVMSVSNGLAHRVTVDPGGEQQSRIAILSGIGETDSVITTGQQFARDGGTISIVQ